MPNYLICKYCTVLLLSFARDFTAGSGCANRGLEPYPEPNFYGSVPDQKLGHIVVKSLEGWYTPIYALSVCLQPAQFHTQLLFNCHGVPCRQIDSSRFSG